MAEPVAVDDAAAGCTAAGKLVYLILEQADRPLSSDEIAARAQLAESSMWHALERLQDQKLIEKRPHPEDTTGGRLVYRPREYSN